ncbi:MAG: MFS transporter [Candidatus Thermoplasmatota archaeon]|nr:MFS transporter [Candidatus Thermoplasmatota archaeon]
MASCIRSVGFGASWPFMAIYFNVSLGISIFYVGIIFTLLSVSSSLFSFLGGYLADRVGRKKTLVLGSFAGFFIYLVIAVLVLTGAGFLIITGVFILSSISGALVFPSASALVADVTSVKDRNSAYSIYRIMSNVGWAIGPITGGYIAGISVGYIFILMSVTNVLQLVLIVRVLADKMKDSSTPRPKGYSLDRRILLFAAGTFFVTLVASQFSVTLPVYSTKIVGILEQQLGYIYAVNGIVVVLGQYPMTWVTRRLDVVTVMILGSLFYSLGYFLVAFSSSLYGLMLDMVFITVGENLTTPGMNTVVSRIAPAGKTGRYMGFLSMANSGGRAVGPSIGAFLMFFFAYRGLEVWGTLASLGIVSISILSIFYFAVYRAYSSYGNDAV